MTRNYKIKKASVVFIMLISIILIFFLFEGINFILSVSKPDLAYWLSLSFSVLLITLVRINELYVVINV